MSYILEWCPQADDDDGLRLSVRCEDRDGVARVASRLDPGAAVRLSGAELAPVIATAADAVAWGAGVDLTPGAAAWPEAARHRGELARSLELLDAFVAWSRSRGLVDEAGGRRITIAAQSELRPAPDGRR